MPDKEDKELKEALEVMFGEHGADGIVDSPKPEGGAKPGAPAPEPDKKEGDVKPADDGKGGTPTPAPAKVAKPKAAPRKRAAEPSVDLRERDRIVAEAAVAGAAAAERRKGKDVTDDLPKRSDMTEKERETIAVMEFLGKKDPRYATLAERTMDHFKQEKEYAAEWKKKNPDKDYDPESDEHNEFYEKHQPQYEQDVFDAAKKDYDREVILAQARDERRRESTEQQRVEAERERQKTEADEVQAEADGAEMELIKAVSPVAEKFFTVDGKTQLTDAQWEAFAEEHPMIADDLREEAEFLGRKIKELERLNRYPKTYPPKGDNRLHVAISQRILDAEDEILALPPKDQSHNGKTFITQSDYGQRRHQIIVDKKMDDDEKRTALRELESKHWMLSPSHAKALIIDQHRQRAEKITARAKRVEERLQKKAGKTAGEIPPKPGAEEKPAAPAAAAPAPTKRVAPEKAPTSPGGDIMPTGGNGGAGSGTALETLQSIGI